jgi:hemolysin activation/secretion protein
MRLGWVGDEPTRGTWKTALRRATVTCSTCATSNRALDQMKCVSNQGADMQVMPIDAPSQSDVVVTVKHAKS